DVRIGNIETMSDAELPSARFDLILALDVLEHLINPWSAMRRIHGLLKPDGALVVRIPNVSHCSVSLALLRGRWDYAESGLMDRTHLRFFTEAGAKALVTSSGLVLDCCSYVYHLPSFLNCTLSKNFRWYMARAIGAGPLRHLIIDGFFLRVRNA